MQRKSLQVLANKKLNMLQQHTLAAVEVYCVLHFTNKSVASKEITPFSVALMRPDLDFCAQLRVPQCKRDRKKLERVQQKVITVSQVLEHIMHEERLKKWVTVT